MRGGRYREDRGFGRRNFANHSPEIRQNPQPFIPPENRFPALQEEFKEVPSAYILKVLKDVTGEKNVRSSLTQELAKIKQIESDDWVKNYYKAFQCPLLEFCQNYHCLYYHSLSEKRRIFKYKNYNAVLCENPLPCPNLDLCENAHTVNEIIYHPYNYRSSICPYSKLQNMCLYGKICPFSHDSIDENQMFQEYIDLHNYLDNLSREMSRVEIEILNKKKEEEDLSKKMRCSCGNDKEYVRSPCGHGACQSCKDNSKCKICLKESIVHKINFN